jgi:hypothetical protein
VEIRKNIQKVLEDISKNKVQTPHKEQQNESTDLVKVMEESAVEVSLSMGAQVILAMMEATQTVKDNSAGQKTVLDFLAGKVISDDFNLANTGYEGKPIDQLSKEEATALVEGEGFFSVTSTSNRVADFVIGLAGDDLENLEKVREGIIQGFEDAKKLWGGELPEISYETQNRTLELIDQKIEALKSSDSTSEIIEEESEVKSIDISV